MQVNYYFQLMEKKTARYYAEKRKEQLREEQLKASTKISLDDLFEKKSKREKYKI